jgi:hypothetical protein
MENTGNIKITVQGQSRLEHGRQPFVRKSFTFADE